MSKEKIIVADRLKELEVKVKPILEKLTNEESNTLKDFYFASDEFSGGFHRESEIIDSTIIILQEYSNNEKEAVSHLTGTYTLETVICDVIVTLLNSLISSDCFE